MFLAKQVKVISPDVLNKASCGRACSVEKQTVARSGFSPFVVSGLEKSLLTGD